MHIWKKIDKVLDIIIAFFYLTIISVVSIQVVCRVIPALTAPSWTEELSRYLMVYLVAFSTGFAIKENAFISVDTLRSHLGEKKALVLDLILNIIIMVFFGFLFVSCIQFFKLGFPQNSITMPRLTMSIVYFSLVILVVQVISNLALKVKKTVEVMKNMEAI